MKIAEGLILKSNLESKIAELQSRITKNLLVQDGDQAQEDPQKLIDELIKTSEELTKLIGDIQKANAENLLKKADGSDYGMTIQRALVKKEGLINLQDRLRYFASESAPVSRYSQSEIKIVPTLDASKLQELSDEYAKEARELDIAIQRTNWQIDL